MPLRFNFPTVLSRLQRKTQTRLSLTRRPAMSALTSRSATSFQAEENSTPRKLVGRAGPWQLVKLVGESNFARIYTARAANTDDALPAAYAVKMLRKEWWRDTRAIESFRREAWVGSKVAHPNVVPVLSANVKQPPFYLAMPLLAGESLRDRLDRLTTIPLPEALWIARQVVEGLAAISQTVGMVHGDVKPENILVAPTGHATLVDLGCAQSAKESRTWADEAVMGSLAYIAPELVTSAYAASPQSDQYSLGVALYEMLTGRLPFEATDPAELVAMHRGQKPPCIRTLCPALPKCIASLVHTLLSKDPMRRAGTHDELVSRLVRLEIDSFGIRQSA